ncbi:MAG: hypothetical protein H7A33_02000 [Deltaproteobacteria bacterium]|nr:hypothetical protein [Deltaproteobacteria bacterium]
MKRFENIQSTPLDNLFGDDLALQRIIQSLHEDPEAQEVSEKLAAWQSHLPKWNALAEVAARVENLPRIEERDRLGNPIERVVVPQETKTIREEVVRGGIFECETEFEQFSKIYLLAQMGESGVMCPLACTDGLIRVMNAVGSEELKDNYLPRILSAEFPLAGSQFVTEKMGGSDVGVIEAVVKTDSLGNKRLFGQKWFCSTPEEFYVVAAREEGAPSGTQGISLYFVPRVLEENGVCAPNRLRMVRLKDKLGTQSLPTAEIDFDGALCFPLGKEEEGFHNLMTYVLNCSRLHNAANALGIHRRAFIEARQYASERVAFGKPLIEHALVGETLIDMLSHLNMNLLTFFRLIKKLDDDGWVPDDTERQLWLRFWINLLKYRSSARLVESTKSAILLLGGNGIVNDFSILPRLMRDGIIMETWEGTHNTLCLQIMRDARRFDLFGKLKSEIEQILSSWPDDVLRDSQALYVSAFEEALAQCNPENLNDSQWVLRHSRRVVDLFADLLQTGMMVRMGVSENDTNTLVQASYLIFKFFGGRSGSFSSPALARFEAVGLDLIHERPVSTDTQ